MKIIFWYWYLVFGIDIGTVDNDINFSVRGDVFVTLFGHLELF